MRGWSAWLLKQTKAQAGKITFCEKHKHHSKTLRKERMLKQDAYENALKNFFFSGENIQHAIVPCQRKDQQTYQKMYMFILVSKWCKSFNVFNYNEALQPK